MKKHFLKLGLCLLAFQFGMEPVQPLQAKSMEVSAEKFSAVRIPVAKSQTVKTGMSFSDVMVGDPEIADVQPLTDRSIYILGRKIGATSISIYDDRKQLVGMIEVEVSYDTSRLSSEIRTRVPNAKINVSSVNGRIMLSGTAPDALAVDKAVMIAKNFGDQVINSVTVTRPQQVMLEVRFIEASRTAGRELGINWNVVASNATLALGSASLISSPVPFGTAIGKLLSGGVQAEAIIQAMEDKGLARRLAEPNLVAMSGDTASFLAGGEFPFPVAGQNNQVTVEFKRFGVGLAFTPTVLSEGLINLKIEPEVSQLDTSRTVRVGGLEVPSLVVRRASTTVELRDGQSFAIAGLLQNNTNTSQDQLPWLGDVPVIGALFRSASFQKNETDLAIIITPRLVRPTAPGEQLRTPLDSTVAGNDLDVFLMGKGEVSADMVRRIEGEGLDRPNTGHIIRISNGGGHASRY